MQVDFWPWGILSMHGLWIAEAMADNQFHRSNFMFFWGRSIALRNKEYKWAMPQQTANGVTKTQPSKVNSEGGTPTAIEKMLWRTHSYRSISIESVAIILLRAGDNQKKKKSVDFKLINLLCNLNGFSILQNFWTTKSPWSEEGGQQMKIFKL